MKVHQVEIYYGYYSGDAQVWDTIYIPVPKKLMKATEEELESYAIKQAIKELNASKSEFAFIGVYSIQYGE